MLYIFFYTFLFLLLHSIAFPHSHSKYIEIHLSSSDDYKFLANMGIRLDHYRTYTLTRAYVSKVDIINLESNNFSFNEIQNDARNYYLELINHPNHINNPMEMYHNCLLYTSDAADE